MVGLPTHRVSTHPGEILALDFLEPLRLTQVDFARHLGISLQRVNEIVRGKRGVTAETAWLLSQALGTTPQFWLDLQSAHDLTKSRPARRTVRRIVRRAS